MVEAVPYWLVFSSWYFSSMGDFSITQYHYIPVDFTYFFWAIDWRNLNIKDSSQAEGLHGKFWLGVLRFYLWFISLNHPCMGAFPI